MERCDGRQRVGQVVEDEDQIGLDERRGRDADRVAFGLRDRGLECGNRVVGKRAHGAAGEARHPLGREDPAARHEGTDGVERVARLERGDREVGRIGRLGDRAGLDPGDAVTDFEQPPRADAEERVAAETLTALDRFEEIRRAAFIEAEEGPDRRLEVGRTRGAQEDRVGVGGKALRLRQADRIGCRHRCLASENQNDHSSWGRKVVPSAVPPSFGDAALS